MPPRRGIGVRRGCEHCRTMHSKCDKKQPRCGNCMRADKPCIQAPAYRFSTDETALALEFPHGQIWVETPPELEFVWDTPEAFPESPAEQFNKQNTVKATCETLPYESSPFIRSPTSCPGTTSTDIALTPSPAISLCSAESNDASPDLTSSRCSIGNASANHSENLGDELQSASNWIGQVIVAHNDSQSTPLSVHQVEIPSSPPATSSGASRGLESSPHFEIRGTDPNSPFSAQHSWRQEVAAESNLCNPNLLYKSLKRPQQSDRWKLTSPDEPFLIRYFVTDLASFFDYCDPERSFSTTVVQRAVECPTLLLAILATSSRQLSLTRGYDSYRGDQYHRECLSLLIPMLDDRRTLLDESICAATVILRLYEELSVSLLGEDTRSHLLGTHLFVLAQEHHTTGILQAAFLVALRQEINVALCTRKPTQLQAKYLKCRGYSDLKSDWDWTTYIIVLCAQVLNYCYCSPRDESSQSWAELYTKAEDWLKRKSSSFEPLLCREGRETGQLFPEIWFLNDCHVAGHIFYLICHILLTAYSPHHPRIGPERVDAMKATDDTIRDDVRKICGIALSNPHAQPALFKACTIIVLCGDLFTDRVEQEALLDLLLKTETKLAWPTAKSQDYLKSRWGWSSPTAE